MEDMVWKTLWKIKAPPKVLHLMWKALTNCLPTRTQLYSKHIHVKLSCPFYHIEEETIVHVLLHCQFSKSCWNRFGLASVSAHSSNFFLRFKDLVDKNTPKLMEEAVMLCWSIWQAKNGVIWNQKSCSTADVMFTVRLTLAQWKHAHSRKFEPLLVPSGTYDSGERWTKPTTHMLKINVDGAIFKGANAKYIFFEHVLLVLHCYCWRP
uniref:Reverse transcriptase zinc-binding domain-containing protein n=1 Tax=Cannabis sativa TaxID=3483 RepID=A0A803PZ53_CANSA